MMCLPDPSEETHMPRASLAVLAVLSVPLAALAVDRATIDYWTSTYDGANFTQGKFACVAPTFPAVSTTNEEILKLSRAFTDWRACYDGAGANLRAAYPLATSIPADVTAAMTPAERSAAAAHLDQVYEHVSEVLAQQANMAMAAYDSWRGATEAYVAETNRKTAERQAAAQRVENEKYQQVGSQMAGANATAMPRGVR
jgi:hypothetical protein